jgi:uncharacterized membrane protein YbhN (UPF0104 family)
MTVLRNHAFKLKIVLGLALIVGLSWFVMSRAQTIASLGTPKLSWVLSLIFAHALGLLLTAMVINAPLKQMAVSLRFSEWFGLTAVSSMFNLFLPARGGTAIRWFYLWEERQLPTKRFITANVLTSSIGAIVVGVLGLATKGMAPLFAELEGIFWLLALGGLGITIHRLMKGSEEASLASPKMMLSLTVNFSLLVLIHVLKSYFAFRGIGVEIGFFASAEVSLLVGLATIVPTLPGSLGVKEVVMAIASERYGVPAEVAIMASMIDRAALWVVLIPIGPLAYINIFIRSKKSKRQEHGLGSDLLTNNFQLALSAAEIGQKRLHDELITGEQAAPSSEGKSQTLPIFTPVSNSHIETELR